MEESNIKKVCPPAAELSNIKTDVTCTEPDCTSMFSNTSNLNMHLFKVHKVGDPEQWKKSSAESVTQYHCPDEKCLYNINSKRFFQKLKYLKQHYLKVHAEKSFKCSTCEKGFPTEAALKHHTPICGVKFTCSCNMSYGSNEALMTHVKRTGHVIDKKYKSAVSGKSSQPSTTAVTIPVYLAAVALSELSDGCFKTVVDIGIQTEPTAAAKRVRRISCKAADRGLKRGTSIETQTGAAPRKKRIRISAETQTSGGYFSAGSTEWPPTQPPRGKQAAAAKRRKSMETQTTDAVKRGGKDEPRKPVAKKDKSAKMASLVEISPASYELDIDVSSSDFWTGQKNSSSTQTSPGKMCDLEMLNGITQTESDLYGLFETDPGMSYIHSQSQAIKLSGYSEDNNSNSSFNVGTLHHSYDLPGTSHNFVGFPGQRDPSGMLRMEDILTVEQRYNFEVNRSCSIETQTEIDSFLLPTECFEEDSVDSFTLSSTIETQTTEDMATLDQLMYSNMCTQTCDEFLFSDLGFVDIQTQTAGSEYESDLALVSAETQTRSSSHMETQTDEFREMIAEFEKQNRSEELL